ncbi:DUF6364 family protein [Shivajiella indica]|uniref:DUF6364 family protein n=1 Tax=Shivajiella indica TaxID=872115 RepID=A0ABW5BDT5_9BACT
MKKPLNITVDENLIKAIKQYAENKETSISALVEDYFERLIKTKKELESNVSLLEFVKNLPEAKMKYPEDFDWKEEYFKKKGK